MDAISLQTLVTMIDQAFVCPGNPDNNFLAMAAAHKGQILPSQSGDVKAYLESLPVVMNGECYPATVRTSSCTLLVNKGQCMACKSYRPQLRAVYSRWLSRLQSLKTTVI